MKTNVRKNILLVTIGSSGDVYPFLALAVGLKKRGHHVTLVTSMYFEEVINNESIKFIPVGSSEDYLNIIQNPDLWDPQKSMKFYGTEVVGQLIRPMYEIITGYMDNNEDAILIAQGLVFAAQTAHEMYGYPFVSLHLQPGVFRSVYDMPLLSGWFPRPLLKLIFNLLDKLLLDPALTPSLNEFRAELGLGPIKNIADQWIHSPQKTIGLFEEWFAPIQPDWPPQTELTGFVFYDPNADDPLPTKVSEFLDAGEAPIVFTPGTSYKHGEDFFNASVEACQILGKRGILLTKYGKQIPKDLPQSIKYFDYVPFGSLLPHAAALVHHGGVGTLAQALKAGIPQLIRPVAQDQPDNAARLVKLGVASSLQVRKYTGGNVAEKLDYLLTSEQVKDACSKAKNNIDPDKAILETALIIERL